jgi:hypothetical protein
MNLNDLKQKLGRSAGNTQFLIIALITVIFLIAALVVYRKYVSTSVSKKYVANNEFSKNGIMNSVNFFDIYFFL